MLAIASVLAALTFFGRPVPAPSPTPRLCPAGPLATYPAAATECATLELSGRADASGVSLDPAFEGNVGASKLARLGRGDAQLAGYAADGRLLFAFPFQAEGGFDFQIPLDAATVAAVRRIRLTAPAGTTERVSFAHGEPVAEAIATDDAHFVFAWDATSFPAIRIATVPGMAPISFSGGTSTFEQLNVAGRARAVNVTFSDGVRSVVRTVRVFGR